MLTRHLISYLKKCLFPSMWQCNQMPVPTVSYHFRVTVWAGAHILRRCCVIISCSQSYDDTGRLGWLSKILPRLVHQNLSYLIYKNITLNRPLNNHLLADLYRDSPYRRNNNAENTPKASYYHIEAETRWPLFPRRHFQMHLLEWKSMNFAEDAIEICSWGAN